MPPVKAPLARKVTQSKINSRSNPAPGNDAKSLIKEFRERRKAREEETLRKQREARLMRSAQAAAAAASLTSVVSAANQSNAGRRANTTVSSRPQPRKPVQATKPTVPATRPVQATKPTVRRVLANDFEESEQLAPKAPKPRKSFCTARKSISKQKIVGETLSRTKIASKVSKSFPKAIKHTKASQLRLICGNSMIDLAYHGGENLLITSAYVKSLREDLSTSQLPFLRKKVVNRKDLQKHPPSLPGKSGGVNLKSSNNVTPSKIPVKKTSFVSPLTTPPVRTPKPAFLREKLRQWLENNGRSFDDFKHLNCFGISGSAVKRPQTPHRKKILSTSLLHAIPESRENSPAVQETVLSDNNELDTTFTIEEEDKENILPDVLEGQKKAPSDPTEADDDESHQSLDQASGVLGELLKLIKMGFPSDQCELWVRATRRRFPQCGDEAVYWECLAALEHARGDLRTALTCYQRAVLQGADESVQAVLIELKERLDHLNIETSPARGSPAPSCSRQRCRDREGLDSGNIIRSSAIQFVVQEMEPSKAVKKTADSANSDVVFTATPVRRSTRSTASSFCTNRSPRQNCVQSLDCLEPSVRKSLVFKNNTALDPHD